MVESSVIDSMSGPRHFSEGVGQALANPAMQAKLKMILMGLRMLRGRTIPPHTPSDEVRERARLIRTEVINHLDSYLEEFVENAQGHGIQVHWARTAADARRIVLDIARKGGVKRVSKGKSMVSEEVGLREALEHEGMQVTETDLGELLCQLAGQPPSHLIAPAIHMDLPLMARVLSVCAEDGEPLPSDPPALMKASRRWLRKRMLEADMGVTGANFGIAETGTFFIVTNEGNGRMTSSLPRIHVAMMGIERLLPTLDSMPTVLQLLTRSGTGQMLTVYTSMFAGPRRPGDLHGPEEQHLVLVDNGRSKLLGTEFAEALNCIRCGACLNACPVYEKAGGHSYSAVYGGPIGSVLTPLFGESPIKNELPHASSLCGACKEACPVKIDIPSMLIRLRRMNRFGGVLGRTEPWAVAIAGRAISSPIVYKLVGRAARITLRKAPDGWMKDAPGPLRDWTLTRDFPAPAEKPFRERWRERRKGRKDG